MGFFDLFRPKPAPVPAEPRWATEFYVRSAELSPYLTTAYEAASGIKAASTFSDYQGLYSEGGDSWVYAAISAIAQDVSDVRIRPIDWRSGEELEAWPHPALEEPYPGSSLQDLVELWCVDLLTTANAFGVLDTSGELHQVPPDRIRIYPDRLGHVARYGLMSSGGEREHPLEPERVVHFRLPNPASRHWGTGPSQALRTMLMISDGETQYLVNFYKSGARPSGFISFDKETTLETAKAAMRDFDQKHGGKRNHGKTAALPGASYETIGTAPVEGGVVEIRKLTLEALLAAYGIPPFRLHLLEGADYANAKQQERVYDLKTVLPFSRRRIVSALNSNRLLVPDPRRVRLDVDDSRILNIHRDELAISQAAATAVNAGLLTREEARARGWDLGPLDADVPETGPISALSGFGPPSPPEPPPGDEEPPELEEARQRVIAIRTNPAIRAAYERSNARRREDQVKRLRRVISPTLTAQGKRVLEVVDRYRKAHPETRDQGIPSELRAALEQLDFSETADDILETWLPEIMKVLRDEGLIKTELVGLSPETFSVSDPQVLEFVREFGAAEVRNVTEGTKQEIARIVEDAMREGQSVDDLSKRLRESPMVGATRVRADRIAQTETAAAAGYGTQRAYENANELGIRTRKRWLTVGDENVRESHAAAANDGPIEVGALFSNGLKFPGDPDGAPEERINERCDMVPEVD